MVELDYLRKLVTSFGGGGGGGLVFPLSQGYVAVVSYKQLRIMFIIKGQLKKAYDVYYLRSIGKNLFAITRVKLGTCRTLDPKTLILGGSVSESYMMTFHKNKD